MKAAVIEAEKQIAVRDIQRPDLPEDGALIRVTGCGVCGSDLNKLLNRNLEVGTVLGHEVVGVIEECSPSARQAYPNLGRGQRVSVAHHVPCQECYYCRHDAPSMCQAFKSSNIIPGGFSEYIAVSAAHLAHTVFPLPEDVTDAEASCIEPLACCLRAVDRITASTAGRTILMMGLGFIGLMTAQYLNLQSEPAYQVFGYDIKPDRVDLAKRYQMLDTASTDFESISHELRLSTEGRGVDVVFLTVVNTESLNLAMNAVRDGGTLLLFTSFVKNEPILNQNELYFREITVITSYSPSLKHLKKSYDLIVQKQIQVTPLISHNRPLQDLPAAMEAYRGGEAMKVFITL